MATIPLWLTLTGGGVSLAGGTILWKRWRAEIVDIIDRAVHRKVTRFGRQYREYMLGSLRRIDVKGLATIGFYTPELDEVFVDVSLAYRAPHQIPEGVLTQTPAEVTDRHSLNDFLDNEDPAVLAVVGVPGSGKTTLLRHTARALCRHPRGRRTVPLLLYLRDHVTKIVANPQVTLPMLVVDTLGRMGTTEPPGWFEQHLRAGHAVVLLDGLDEVAKKEDRAKVAAWVTDQTRQYPRNDFVITSRPQGYRDAPIDGATVVQVRSFTGEQVTRLVHGWYLAIERHATNEAGPDVHLRANEAADDLLKRLDTNPALHDLTVNPLLLTMIANVHRFRGALPGSRTDLYAEICQVMLSRRQEAKNLPIELSGDKKEALLRRLAFVMMQKQVRDVARTDLITELKPLLRRVSTQLTEERFLADVSSNGLLIERESGWYSFAHLTFQEYLAAGYVRVNGLVQVLADAVDDPWWLETTLLCAARADGDLIVKACLDSGSVPALSLAFGIAEQGGELAPELRAQLDDVLTSTDMTPERRRLRNGVPVRPASDRRGGWLGLVWIGCGCSGCR
ncbi:MAG TPA: NACHT domain-containing protein [Actinophytocola sp.]|jgi:predicted NACHT family NTPase|uniref:NACHT domain-containing protein n=1 Tax=Actinophytocola sp. TaxID=1872138 RepID=UPI002DFEE439|nr:NACHT domain-containing protein [Actinophytocola sp.]